MKSIIEFIEKRFSPRINVRFAADFMIVNGSSEKFTEYHAGTITDLSKKGCCLLIDRLNFDGFYLMKCIEDSDYYKINLKLEEVEILGKICWINTSTEGKMQGFKIGIEVIGENKIYRRV